MRLAPAVLARAVLAAGFVLFALSGAAALWSIAALRGAVERQDRAQAVIDAAGVAIHDLHELELEHLRFISSGQAASWNSVAEDSKNLRVTLDALEHALDAPARARHMPEVRRETDAYFAVVEAAARARRERGRDAVLDELTGAAWRARFVRVEDTLKTLKSTTLAIARAESAASERLGRRVSALVLGGSGVALLLLIVFVVLLRRARDERQVFERQLRRSEEQLRAIFDNTADAILLLGADCTIEFANPAALTMFGRSARELQGSPCMLLAPARTREANDDFMRRMREADSGATRGCMHTTLARADGAEFPAEIRVGGFVLAGQRKLTCIVRDLSAEAAAERAKREIEEKFQALLESAPDAMLVVGRSGAIQIVNAQAERLFGYARAELIGQRIELLVPERWRAAHAGHRGGFMRGPRARAMGAHVDLYARRKDGSEFPTEISLSPVQGGNEVMIISAIRDITERKREEEATRARERFIRTITDNIPAAVTYVDRDERYRFVNRAYVDWLGIPRESIEGHAVREVIGDAAYAALGPKLACAFAGETVRYERTQPDPAGGSRELAVTLIPDGDAQGGVVGQYALIEDVTESKRLARLKNEFVSTVSHELRTPLTSIRGSLGLLEGGATGPLGDRAKTLVTLARQNCERLGRLINDILDMEKIEAGKMVFDSRPVDLMGLIEEALAANEGYARGHATGFAVTTALPGVKVLGDKDRLIQVLTNLLSNAVKFSPPGACVEVAVERRGARIRVSVIDHGPGISDEFRNRIFEKFSQADSSDARKKGGSGLGLAISKMIVERHGGELGFTTGKGEGTTFYFDLPEMSARRNSAQPPSRGEERRRVLVYVNEQEAGKRLADAIDQAGFLADITDNKESAERLFDSHRYVAVALGGAEAGLLRSVLVEPTPERPASILHVEDDADMRQVIAAHLEPLGRVDGAATLTEARERLAHEHYDLLLLDIGLPDGSAWSLVEELQARPSWPRIVVFSAEAVAAERMAGVSAALQKSRDSESRLVETVKSVLAQGQGRKR